MKKWIALFRGINVGGRHLLPMKELKRLLEELGLVNVKTYIQSGNAVFESGQENASGLSEKIEAAVEKSRGFRPELFVMSVDDLANAVASNPFPEAVSAPKTLHLTFLSSVPKKPDLETLEDLKSNSERFVLKGTLFYLHAPDGIGRSKLCSRVEKSLGVSGTSRNWRTVRKLMEMAQQGHGTT